jgi:membrane protein DedA with SNARE-associated domain
MEYLLRLVEYMGQYPYLVVLVAFLMMMFLFPIPEEAALFIGGTLSASAGGYMWAPTLAAGIIGIVISDYWPFILSKTYGQRLINKPIFKRFIPPHRQEKAVNFVQKHGVWAVFIVRFIPGGFRNPTYVVCGLSNITSKAFVLTSLLGAFFSIHFSFWAGYFLSDELPPIADLIKTVERNSIIIVSSIISILIVFYIYRKIYKKYFKKKI